MRVLFLGLALSLLTTANGCSQPTDDGYDNCSLPGPPTPECYPNYQATVHWSFETRSGDSKESCLPGSPDVAVTVRYLQGDRTTANVPCASGQLPITVVGTFAPLALVVTSNADRPYSGSIGYNGAPGDLPPVVVYTDDGYISVRWFVRDAMGADLACEAAGIASFYVYANNTLRSDGGCSTFDRGNHLYATGFGPVVDGTYTVRVDAHDQASNVITTSSVDVTVAAGASVSAPDLVLQP